MKLIHLPLKNGEALYVNPEHISAIFDTRIPQGFGRSDQVVATLVLSNEIHYKLAVRAIEIVNLIEQKVART